ncbi:hypothetical protein JTE90_021787 [Oedothorax gibbosus]|uniref:Uncharacterized protein n=1 Tax=Oedothorax gibbosus TaxID=931172 RepID=A0AAV6TGG9_9ARAC|nr:hypothetical protein JTE90_021787 [Oedothorax gibbosus]
MKALLYSRGVDLKIRTISKCLTSLNIGGKELPGLHRVLLDRGLDVDQWMIFWNDPMHEQPTRMAFSSPSVA